MPCANGWCHESVVTPNQLSRSGGNVAVVELDFGSQRLESSKMLVDRSYTDGTATRERNASMAQLREQGTEDQYAGAHRLDQLVGRIVGLLPIRGTQPNRILDPLDLDSQMLQQRLHGLDVSHRRQSDELDRLGAEERRVWMIRRHENIVGGKYVVNSGRAV